MAACTGSTFNPDQSRIVLQVGHCNLALRCNPGRQRLQLILRGVGQRPGIGGSIPPCQRSGHWRVVDVSSNIDYLIRECQPFNPVNKVDPVILQRVVVGILCRPQVGNLETRTSIIVEDRSDLIICKVAGIDRRICPKAAVENLAANRDGSITGSTLHDVIAHAGKDPVSGTVAITDVAQDEVIAIGADKNVRPRCNPARGCHKVADNMLTRGAGVENLGDNVCTIAASHGRIAVLPDRDEAIPQKASHTIVRLVTLAVRIDLNGITNRCHGQSGPGRRIQNGAKVARIDIGVPCSHPIPLHDDVRTAFAADARNLDRGKVNARRQGHQVKRSGGLHQCKTLTVNACTWRRQHGRMQFIDMIAIGADIGNPNYGRVYGFSLCDNHLGSCRNDIGAGNVGQIDTDRLGKVVQRCPDDMLDAIGILLDPNCDGLKRVQTCDRRITPGRRQRHRGIAADACQTVETGRARRTGLAQGIQIDFKTL